MSRINCKRCIYYYVTWEPRQPHGCKKFGFKSFATPSIEVRKNSGKSCEAFVLKEIKRS